MLTPSQIERLTAFHRRHLLIYGAMVVSVAVYAIVINLILRQQNPFPGYSPLPADIFNKLRPILAILAMGSIFIAQFLRRMILKGSPPQSGTSTIPLPLARIQSAAMISYALAEIPAIFGLVLFLLNGNPLDFYLFGLLSFIYYAFFYPRLSQWQEWLEERGEQF
jgi:F0F1-type ATP synthase membrane subunit c/vacuolar-type H+-ATPase subunit K